MRVQASGPLGDVLRRMAAVADEFSTRFDPYWKDPLLDQQRKEQNSANNDENAENTGEPSANGETTDFSVDTPPLKTENGDSKPAGRGGFRGRGRGGGRGFNRGGRGGGFRGRGGIRRF